MASSSSSGENTEIISKEDVLEQLQYSSTFSWCVYRKRGLIRHVGIIIMFDGKPFCTVDFEVENLRTSCFVAPGCRSKVFIKRVLPGFENCVGYCGDALQYLNTRNIFWRWYAAWTIRKLVTPNHRLYSLLKNNCRRNTIDAVNRVCDHGQCIRANLNETEQMLLRTQREDLLCLVLIGTIVCGALGIYGVHRFRQ